MPSRPGPGKRGERFVCVVLGEPQRRQADAHDPAVAVLVGECGQGLLGALGFTKADQGLHQKCPVRQDHQVRCGQASGQPVGGLEGGQCVRVPAARQLKPSADVCSAGR